MINENDIDRMKATIQSLRDGSWHMLDFAAALEIVELARASLADNRDADQLETDLAACEENSEELGECISGLRSEKSKMVDIIREARGGTGYEKIDALITESEIPELIQMLRHINGLPNG